MLETPNTAGNLIPFSDPSCFDQRWMFGAQIGKDTTNNFAFSMSGLAIRTADNRYVAPQMNGANVRMTDVTCLTIGIDPGVYRIPVDFDGIEPGDLLVRSDSPFQLIFVTSTDRPARRILGVDPLINEFVEIIVPEQELDVPSFLVKVISLLDGFSGLGGGGLTGGRGTNLTNLLPFLLCGNTAGGAGGNASMNNNLLLALALGSNASGLAPSLGNNNALFLLLAMQGNGLGTNSAQTLLLASLLSGRRRVGPVRAGVNRSEERTQDPEAPRQPVTKKRAPPAKKKEA